VGIEMPIIYIVEFAIYITKDKFPASKIPEIIVEAISNNNGIISVQISIGLQH